MVLSTGNLSSVDNMGRAMTQTMETESLSWLPQNERPRRRKRSKNVAEFDHIYDV